MREGLPAANLFDCDIVWNEFDLLLGYNAHLLTNSLEKGMNSFTHPQAMDLIIPPLFFNKD